MGLRVQEEERRQKAVLREFKPTQTEEFGTAMWYIKAPKLSIVNESYKQESN